MKLYIMTDLEGVAGVTTFYVETTPDGRYYEQARSLLTAEVNAAVDGALSEGVTEVLVGDWHGPGAIAFSELHAQAKLLHGRPMGPRDELDRVLAEYDVSMIIGQHAMAGVQTGNMNHTQSSQSIDSFTLNGQAIGEIAQFALYEGTYGRPVIFLSGDDAACVEAVATVPGIHTVSVKQGVGRNSAVSVSAVEARRRIREGAAEAVRRHRETPVSPLSWDGPYVLEKRFFHTDTADAVAQVQGAERVDGQTVRFRCDSLRDILYR
jgi:D-amino peptidase